MLGERLKWLGTSISSAALVYLSWKQVADHLPGWSIWALISLVVVASLLMFPYGKDQDGSTRRLFQVGVRGRHNPTFVSAGDNSPNTGNIVSTGRGSQTVHVGSQLTYSEVRQISVDASLVEVLPAARAVASEKAIAEIDRRLDVMTDKVLTRINETNPGLFVRWDDPRFLAVLTSAQRSYAETGDEDLGDLLAGLVASIAEQPIRSRREIILRQAIDVAPRLTTAHINALTVNMYLGNYRLTQPLDTDALIGAFDTLLRPYYGRLPTNELDYQYMSSTGACYIDQLRSFSGGPYQSLLRKYPNSMYPAFTFTELQDSFLSEENREANINLLIPLAESPNDVVQTPQGTAIDTDKLWFRVAPDRVGSILGDASNADQQLAPTERELRNLVRQRSLTEQALQQRVRELRPELAGFLDFFQRTGGLGINLHPVGFMLARHQIASTAPETAALIDTAFDES